MRLPTDKTIPLAPGESVSVASKLPTIDPANYTFKEIIAAGGMGRIRAAVDNRLGRDVALKELLPGASREAAIRFEREALVTARLQHPSIISVYEAGQWPGGSPFLAMRLVPGRSLKQAIAEARTFDARLALLPHAIAITDAIAYAHDRRIIHRDLKPANIVVGPFGETVVIDWGLAKDLASTDVDSGESNPRDAALTRVGAVMGTPSYMAPEQAAARAVDERTDVYALGAILYHLLAGEAPFVGESEAILAAIVKGPPPPIAEVAPGTPIELANIVDRAMSRDPRDRYATAHELAEDLRRFQAGQLVAAHRYTRTELVRRFVRSHRGQIALAALALACVGGAAAYFARGLYVGRNEAETARADAVAKEKTARAAEAMAIRDRDEAFVTSAAADLATEPTHALNTLLRLSENTEELGAARLVAAEARDLRLPRMTHLRRGEIRAMASSIDGTSIATDHDERSVRLWNTATWTHRELGAHEDRVTEIAFAPDGNSIASISADGGARIWRLDGKDPARFTLSGARAIAYAPDGKRVAFSGTGGTRVVDVASGVVAARDDKAATRVELVGDVGIIELADGSLVASERGKPLAKQVRAWDVAANRVAFIEDDRIAVVDLAAGGGAAAPRATPRIVGRELGVSAVAIARDGRVFTFAQRRLVLWPSGAASPTPRLLPAVPLESVRALELSPDERTLAIIATDGIALCDLREETISLLRGSNDSGDHALTNSELVVTRRSRIVRWALQSVVQTIDTIDRPRFAGYLRDGRRVLSNDRRVAIGERVVDIAAGIVGRAAIGNDGRFVAVLGADGIARTIDTNDGTIHALDGSVEITPPDANATIARKLRQERGWLEPIAFSPDGSRVVAAGRGTLHVWLLADGKRGGVSLGPSDIVDFAITPSADVIAATRDKRLHVVPLATGIPRVVDETADVQRIAVAANGAIATAGFDGQVRTWHIATSTAKTVAHHHTDFDAIAFSADGTTLLSGDENGHAILGRSPAFMEVQPFLQLTYPVLEITASPDGKQFAIATSNGGYIFDVATQHVRSLHIAGAVGAIEFSPDGTRFIAIDDSRHAHEWPDDLPRDEVGLRAWLQAAAKIETPPR